MNIEDHISALLAKKLANGASVEELNELDELSRQHPVVQDRIKLLTEWWHSDTGQDIEANSYLRFQNILERIKSNRFE